MSTPFKSRIRQMEETPRSSKRTKVRITVYVTDPISPQRGSAVKSLKKSLRLHSGNGMRLRSGVDPLSPGVKTRSKALRALTL
jgi:hypothetical protein